MTIARKEAINNQPEKFYNKNYFNPEYLYNTEGDETLRIYSEKDNVHTPINFTNVLDSAYRNVIG